MRRYLMICAMLLSGCDSLGFHIPNELLQGCYLDDDKPIVTVDDLTNEYSDAVTALACANGRIEAIADIYHGADK